MARFPELSALARENQSDIDHIKSKYRLDENGRYYIYSGQKKLRIGYTTGTCAALAAAGAARLLLTGHIPESVSIRTPGGLWAEMTPRECYLINNNNINHITARCSIEKDGGDDPDVTTGHWITADVRKTDDINNINNNNILIDGGEGVGRVTKPGLDQPVGAAAINHVPRQMIRDAVERERAMAGYTGGLAVMISVPDGAELAKKTFNPTLGIKGGISILGTTGIVEPMSERAMLDAIGLEIHQAAVMGARDLIFTPGAYGAAFINNNNNIKIPRGTPVVKCANFIGDALDMAIPEGFENILFIGHIGKLIKLAGGIMNTHSRAADCRRELFCAHAAINGADENLCRDLMNAATTEACVDLLDNASLRGPVLDSLFNAIQDYLDRRVNNNINIKTGAVLFSNAHGYLGRTKKAREILLDWERNQKAYAI